MESSFLRIHDRDPTAYHEKLAKVGATCAFCQRRNSGEKLKAIDGRKVKLE